MSQREFSEEELRALEAEMERITVDDVLLQTLVSLLNLGARKAGLGAPPGEDARSCGPGPFSMANADTVSQQLQIAGFERPTLTRCDLPIKIGHDLDHAVTFNMALGPAAELLRICPADEVERLRPKLRDEIREVLSDYVQADGTVSAPASTWIA